MGELPHALLISLAIVVSGCSQKKASKDEPIAVAKDAAPAPNPVTSDRFGPKLTPKSEWTRCRQADECGIVYSGCGMHAVVVNQASVPEVKRAWLEACGDRKMIGVVPAPGTYECVEGQCRRTAATSTTTPTTTPKKSAAPPSTERE